MREVHFDERDDAAAFVAALADAGVEAHLRREEFAGEDDAEDAAWIVAVAIAPAALAELAAAAGGWLIPPPAPIVPAPLPQAPRRLKREPAAPRPDA